MAAVRFLVFRFRLDSWWFGVPLLVRGPLINLPVVLATDFPPIQIVCIGMILTTMMATWISEELGLRCFFFGPTIMSEVLGHHFLLRKSLSSKGKHQTVDGSESRRSPVDVGSLSHSLQGFVHPRLFGISSINSIFSMVVDFQRIYQYGNTQQFRRMSVMRDVIFSCSARTTPWDGQNDMIAGDIFSMHATRYIIQEHSKNLVTLGRKRMRIQNTKIVGCFM